MTEQNTQPAFQATLAIAMQGAMIMGSYADHLVMGHVLMGHHDHALSVFIYHRHHQKLPKSAEDLKDEHVITVLDRFKTMYRTAVQEIFNMADRHDALDSYRREQEADRQKKREKKATEKKTADAFKSMSKPDPMGTVAELAERYNVSLSVVRKLKREGRLHELGSAVS
ncbi:hypothetical protein YA0089_18890 [Pseudomonas viridiflava]|uniref:hypothetical protein n=1 Tax=Pseudomonas viridiflava TaxID=33069 RepID=UPI0018E5DE04|nr:hypothetical protein [Pseudomonas viridiflava]MBI6725675.1 hypothetical protein [Pseudomonas viridiflava]